MEGGERGVVLPDEFHGEIQAVFGEGASQREPLGRHHGGIASLEE